MSEDIDITIEIDTASILKTVTIVFLFIGMFATGFSAVNLTASQIDLRDGNIVDVSSINPNGKTLNIGGDLDLGNNVLKGVGGTMCEAGKAILGDGTCKTVSSTLSEVLNQGNTANTDIDMNGNDIDNVTYLLGNGGAILLANTLDLNGNGLELDGGTVSNNGGPGFTINDNGRITATQNTLEGQDTDSSQYIGTYTPGCCDDATQPDDGNFTGFTTAWDTGLAMFGLRNYGDDNKDVVINNEQQNDNIRIQAEGKDRMVIDGHGGVSIYDGGLDLPDGGIDLTGSSGISLNNNRVTGAHLVRISDPGAVHGGEGIQWSGSSASIYVAPLDDSNSDGYLQLVNDNNGIALEPGTDGTQALRLDPDNSIHTPNGNLNIHNNDITNIHKLQAQYTHETHNTVPESASAGALGPRAVLWSGSVQYATIENDTTIYRNGNTEITAPTPTSGSFSANQGDIITSNKPVGLKGTGHALPPITAADTQAALEVTRNTPVNGYIFPPYSQADVEVYRDEYRDGSPAYEFDLNPGEVRQFEINNQGTFRVYSDSPILFARTGDHYYAPPPSREVLHTWDEYRLPMKDGTSINSDGPYFYSDKRFSTQQTADASGGDSDPGMPVKMLGDTYVISHEVDGYAVASIEPTEINVYQWDDGNNKFVWNKTHDLTDASRENPLQVERGDQDGRARRGGAFLGLTPPVLITGTNPFYLRTNDQNSDEYAPVGYKQEDRIEHRLEP